MSRSLNLFSDGITQLFRERGGSSVGGGIVTGKQIGRAHV